MKNALSIDVEDYFQVSAFDGTFSREQWPDLELRVERNIDRLLDLFDTHRARATFFTLGWVAERRPGMIRRIVAAGHEIASHGMLHQRVTSLSRDAFKADIQRSKALLEDISGQQVKGYRAPSYSIGRDNLWALDELSAAGYHYSSSIYPVRHDHYGMPEAPRFAFSPRDNGLLEIPVSTFVLGGRNYPCGGGGYFRLYPYAVSRWAIRRVNRRDQQPSVFYLHPWEIDPDQPRVDGIGRKTRFRHYLNLDRTEARLARLLRDFHWERMDRVYASALERVSAAPPMAELPRRQGAT
ncbi:XrtA system polysaccharide deacetylase [Acidihalobacter ferrooxydans]|uniref:Polysaccharide deacetylase n=1 Tax=Acidihalobacter ferrooxydans TaxID=1765967 RepID=A0A1P8UI32_9GAMM|nr:XrtA system polysaccharide deacetylase [Acidihalobacter ferrooxydans]APZ43492.1 polysaccharide deacetylase [Acidihalobacter ferrooxydans]